MTRPQIVTVSGAAGQIGYAALFRIAAGAMLVGFGDTWRRLAPMLILVPAAAVDRTGMRLGWGRGYFDKTLGSMDRRPPVFAIVYDSEVLDELPREAHDQGVDGVVTPSAIHRFTP